MRSCSCGSEPTKASAGAVDDGPGHRRRLAAEQPQQRGLAGAVGADHADDVAGRDRQVQGLEEGAVSVAAGQVLRYQGAAHRVSLGARTRAGGPLPGRVGHTGPVPELPEVETARAVIAAAALDREIAAVDDSDTWVCRPHSPGEIQDALVGRRLTAAHRRGKTMWCDTSDGGPVLSLHLGMSGRIVVTDPDGEPVEGGDPVRGRSATSPDRDPVWDRFTIEFADGGSLRLFDKRRLGRVGLDPDLSRLGPDAALVGVAEFRERMARGRAPVKARLLDQSVIAGVGNLLADETLWQARIDPSPPRRHPGPRRARPTSTASCAGRPSGPSVSAACTPAR